MKAPENLPDDIKMVNDGLMKAGYLNVVSATLVLAGLLLLTNRFVPLALALIAPILVGIITLHLTMQLSGIGPGSLFVVAGVVSRVVLSRSVLSDVKRQGDTGSGV